MAPMDDYLERVMLGEFRKLAQQQIEIDQVMLAPSSPFITNRSILPDSLLDEFQRAPRPAKTATAVLERPAGAPWQLPPVMPTDEYLAAAERIGLDSPAIVQLRLERFLAAAGWPVYPYPKVMAYLEQLANREGPASERAMRPAYAEYLKALDWDSPWGRPRVVPVWAPLRQKDAHPSLGGRRAESLIEKVYDRKVPLHAIEKVATLEETFAGTLAYFVSDYQAVNPDPFLMVLAGEGRYVVDVWDEPGW